MQRIFHQGRTRGAGKETEQLAFADVAAIDRAGERIQPLLDHELTHRRDRGRSAGDPIDQKLRAGRFGDEQTGGVDREIGGGRSGFERGNGIVPSVEPERVQQWMENVRLAGGEEDRVRQPESGSGLHLLAGPKQMPARQSDLPGGDIDREREPGARLIALMHMVIHQARVARERDARTAGGEARLGHHAILVVAQFIARGRDQIDQHLIEIGLARHLPAGDARHHRGDHGVAERFVILGQIIDRRGGSRSPAWIPIRRAVVRETAGAKLERQLGENRIDRVVFDGQGVGRVIAHRLDPQHHAVGGRARGHLRHLHLSFGRAGANAMTAANWKNRGLVPGGIGHDGIAMERVDQVNRELGKGRIGPGRERDDDKLEPIEASGFEVVGPFVQSIGVADHQLPFRWNFKTRESSVPAGRYLISTSRVESWKFTSRFSSVRRWPSQRLSAWVMRARVTPRSASDSGSKMSLRTPPPNSGRKGRSPGLVRSNCTTSSRMCSSTERGVAVRPSCSIRKGKARWRPLGGFISRSRSVAFG